MKIAKFFLLLGVLSLCYSCSDDEEAAASDGIVGQWKVTAIDYSGTSTTSVAGQSFTADFTGTGFDMALDIEFTENPNDYNTSGDYSIKLTTDFMGQTTEIDWTNQGFIGAGTWEQNGNVITVNTPGQPAQEATIISVDASELVLAWATVQTQMQQGVTVTYDVMGTYTFERQ